MGILEKFQALGKKQQKDMAIKFALEALNHIDICNDESCEHYWTTVHFFGKALKEIS